MDRRDACPGTDLRTKVDITGCPPGIDHDGDGIEDPLDRCGDTPVGRKVDSQDCEIDSDGDGIVDALDQCSGTPACRVVDSKGCEFDADKDGVVDALDRCANTPVDEKVDDQGCVIAKAVELPAAQPIQTEPEQINTTPITSEPVIQPPAEIMAPATVMPVATATAKPIAITEARLPPAQPEENANSTVPAPHVAVDLAQAAAETNTAATATVNAPVSSESPMAASEKKTVTPHQPKAVAQPAKVKKIKPPMTKPAPAMGGRHYTGKSRLR